MSGGVGLAPISRTSAPGISRSATFDRHVDEEEQGRAIVESIYNLANVFRPQTAIVNHGDEKSDARDHSALLEDDESDRWTARNDAEVWRAEDSHQSFSVDDEASHQATSPTGQSYAIQQVPRALTHRSPSSGESWDFTDPSLIRSKVDNSNLHIAALTYYL